MTASALPFVPLSEPWLPPECAEAVAAQVATTFVGPGAATQSFGAKLAQRSGTAFGVPVASGTVALSIAAVMLGLRPGDEVILPAYGVISVINALASIGLKPRLVDIDPVTGNIDPAALDAVIGEATKAVVFVDFCGSVGPELAVVEDICRRRGVFLIEDAAWSIGRGTAERPGGSYGDISVTSFSVPKIITTGQGGAVLVHSEAHRDAIICLSDHGDTNWRQTNITRGIGTNLRLSDLSSALGLAQLDRLDDRLARKRRSFEVLKGVLGERLFTASDGDMAMQHVVFMEQPAEAIPVLKAQNIASAQPYRVYSDHPPYADLAGQYPGGAFWARHALYLPFGLAMDDEIAARVGQAVAALPGRFLSPTGRKA